MAVTNTDFRVRGLQVRDRPRILEPVADADNLSAANGTANASELRAGDMVFCALASTDAAESLMIRNKDNDSWWELVFVSGTDFDCNVLDDS